MSARNVRGVTLALALLTPACWYHDASHDPVAADIVGQRFALLDEARLSSDFSDTSDFAVLPGHHGHLEKDAVPLGSPAGDRKQDRVLPAGTEVVVVEVGWWWSITLVGWVIEGRLVAPGWEEEPIRVNLLFQGPWPPSEDGIITCNEEFARRVD